MLAKISLIILFISCLITGVEAQTRVNEIDISGNSLFNISEIENLMVTRKGNNFNKDQFFIDLKTIRDRYKSNGYLFVKIDDTLIYYGGDTDNVDINLRIKEGSRVTIGDIEIKGASAIPKDRILSMFETRKGGVLNEATLNNDIVDLLAAYEAAGLPFAKVNIDEITVYKDGNDDRIRIDLEVTENSRVKIDQVKIKGNETTEDYVIIRELKLDKTKTINSRSLQEMKERLDRLNIFESVSDPKIYTLNNKNESGLLIEVREGNTNTFDGVLGYVPKSGDQNGYFTGLVNVSIRNLFGTGRRIDAKYQQEVRETQELEFRYFEPYLMNLPLNINLGFLQRIQDTTYTKRNLDLKADFLFSDKFTISALAGYERVIPSELSDSVYVIGDSRILSTGVELRFDSRDNIYIPSKGFLYRSAYSYGSKDIFNVARIGDSSSIGSFSIQKYYLNLDVYFSFVKRLTNLVRLFGGEVRSDKLDDADLFRVGGNKYIRGYRNEQFLASRLAAGTFEPRFAISRRGFLFAFFDAGYYFRPADDINTFPEQSGFLYGYGLGIRMETGLGVIGVSYALGKDDGLSDGKINFGLINDF